MTKTPKIFLVLIILLGALYGALLLFSEFRPFGRLGSIESKLADRGDRAKVAAGLSDSTSRTAAHSLQTTVASVSYVIHELVPKALGWGGALVEVGDSVVIVDRAGKLYEWQGGSRAKDLGVRVPMEFDAYRANLHGKPFDHRDARMHFRVMDAFARRSGKGYELLVTHNVWHAERNAKSVRLSVLRFDALANLADSQWQTLLECQPFLEAAPHPSPFMTNEGGGRIAGLDATRVMIAFGGHLYGTKNWPLEPLETGNCYGRALVIDTITGGVEPFARGLRNPQGLFIDSGGVIWETEHGPRGGDELNLLENGNDYGWPHVTYGTAYESAAEFSSGTRVGMHDGYREPIFAWLPAIGISNLIRIDKTPAVWAGDLLIGSMHGMALHRVRIREGRAIFSEPIPLGVRMRDLLQLDDGRILAWTDDGEIVELSVNELALVAGGGNDAEVAPTSGALSACVSCHSLVPGDDSRGPSLHGVIGRPIGGTRYARYSAALRAKTGEWTAEDLREYLRNPGEFAPGTTMPDLALSRETIDDIVLQLEAISNEH
jgi:cytochrome c2